MDFCKDRVLASQAKQLKALLEAISNCCQKRQDYEVNKFSLPFAEARCLLVLSKSFSPSLKNIAEKLDVTKSRVTRLIQLLEDKGLVKTKPNPKDSRNKICFLTSKGKSKVREIENFRNILHCKVLEKLKPEERIVVLSSLDLLQKAMEESRKGVEKNRK
ncbi:MarR family winged helix-turn-helix transcriptional regulator [Desulfonauticus submarinus]